MMNSPVASEHRVHGRRVFCGEHRPVPADLEVERDHPTARRRQLLAVVQIIVVPPGAGRRAQRDLDRRPGVRARRGPRDDRPGGRAVGPVCRGPEAGVEPSPAGAVLGHCYKIHIVYL